MKRYLLFVFFEDMEQGGMDDFISDFDSIEDCRKYYKNMSVSRQLDVVYQIFDTLEKRYIYSGNNEQWQKRNKAG